MTTSLMSTTSTQVAWTLPGSIEKEATPQAIDVSSVPFQIGPRPTLNYPSIHPWSAADTQN